MGIETTTSGFDQPCSTTESGLGTHSAEQWLMKQIKLKLQGNDFFISILGALLWRTAPPNTKIFLRVREK